jgi:hypothetical protein
MEVAPEPERIPPRVMDWLPEIYPDGFVELYGVYPKAVVTLLLVIPDMNPLGLVAL